MGKKNHHTANNHYSRPPGFIFSALSAEERPDDTPSISSTFIIYYYLPPGRGPNYGAHVQTDPLSSTRFSSLMLLFSKMLDLLQREQQGHEDSSPTRSQVAQVTAALNVLSSGGESKHNVHRQDGQQFASPSGGEPQHRVHQPGSW